MAESEQHMNYVRQIVSYIETFPNCCSDLIEADLPSYVGRTTKIFSGHYPDVYYNDNSMIILGEAKTDNDIENKHTTSQIKAYIEEELLFNGEKHIVFCCSFYSLATLMNLVIHLKNKTETKDIKFHFIDSLNRVFHL